MFTPFQVQVIRNLSKLEHKGYTTVDLSILMRDMYASLRDVPAIRLEQAISSAIYSERDE